MPVADSPVRVEIFSDSSRKYPLVRRETITGKSESGAACDFVAEVVADHVILHVAHGESRRNLEEMLPPDYRVLATLRLDGRFLISFDGHEPAALPRALQDLAAIGQAEPDGYFQDSALPNDPRLAEQWALGGEAGAIMAEPAWDRSKGLPSILVAVIDSGIDYNHPDLAANIAKNPGETGDGKETNGIDDDGNGFIDDWHGWDFAAPGVGDNDPMDDREIKVGLDTVVIGHGTHVAGIIGAEGNNGVGVSGVAWRVSLLPVKALDRFGRGTWSDVADALAYAVDRGARISNNAYGTWVAPSSTIKDAIEKARDTGMLFIASAGNGEYPGDDRMLGDDMDHYPYYPASLDVSNIISVAAHGRDGTLASFSNFGLAGADLTAPGVDILSTFVGGQYGVLSGTSMSSAFVSGAAALALSQRPELDRIGLLTVLNAQVKKDERYRTKLRWAGRLDLDYIMRSAARPMIDQRVAAGASHFLQVRPDGTVAGWGRMGSIGLSKAAAVDSTIEPTPTTLAAPTAPTTLIPFQDAIGVAAAGLSSYVLTRSGEVWVAGLVKFTDAAPAMPHKDFTRLRTIPGAVGIAGQGGVGAGHHENVAVVDDVGGVWVSGSNAFRQLGSTVEAAVGFSADFFKVTGLAPAVAVEVSEGTLFAVADDGALWQWGRLAASSPVPALVPGNLPPLASITVRYPDIPRLAGLRPDGSVIFIDPVSGFTTKLDTPVKARFIFAMGADRGVEASGFDLVSDKGQFLADGGDTVNEVVAAAFNGATGVALRSDGTSFSWGSRIGGLRGIGTYQYRTRPSPLLALPRTADAWSGGQGLTVLGSDGRLRGIPYDDSFTPPVSIPAYPVNIAALAPPGASLKDMAVGPSHSLLVFSNGAVLGAGENFTGALGALPPSVTAFQSVGFPGSAAAAAAGYSHSLVRDTLGDVWAAGDNSAGQLGDGGNPGGGVFRRIPSLSNITKIATDSFIRSFALDASGVLWMWGNDDYFAPLALPLGTTAVDFAVVPANAAGPVSHRFAVATRDGRVLLYTNFLEPPSTLPAPVVLAVPNVTHVALGARHGLALDTAGDVFSWGENTAGQLGNGTDVPPAAGAVVRVIAVGGIATINAHGRSSFAVGIDGRFWRWGEDVDLANLLAPDTASQTLAVGLSAVIFDSGNGNDDWWLRYFTIDELEDDMRSGKEADPDSDGISNLLEYALDTNPRISERLAAFLEIFIEIISGSGGSNDGPAAASLVAGERHVMLKFNRGVKRSDLSYRFEMSDDLVNWRSRPDDFEIVVDNEATLIAFDAQPVQATGHRYYRVAVSFR